MYVTSKDVNSCIKILYFVMLELEKTQNREVDRNKHIHGDMLMTHIPIKHGNGFQVLTKARRQHYALTFITSPFPLRSSGTCTLTWPQLLFMSVNFGLCKSRHLNFYKVEQIDTCTIPT